MKVSEFIKMEIDIDVFDDYDERCYIAFCGPMALTETGRKFYEEVLDYDVEILRNGNAIVKTVSAIEAENAKRFFEDIAGYCSADWYDEAFIQL